jgi:hypothetical protein
MNVLKLKQINDKRDLRENVHIYVSWDTYVVYT